jgi:endonuclease/exonuclease/phosphatase family metal-dependent hydrolase
MRSTKGMKNLPLAVKIPAGIIILVVLLAVLLILWLSIGEYRPQDREAVAVNGSAQARVPQNQPLELITWNVGYGALGATEDFIMDGGKGVRPAHADEVAKNVWAIQSFLASQAADFVFLQEVDTRARRSYGINEVRDISEPWNGTSAFAVNYRCAFVPYPLFRFMGQVESGLLTLNTFASAPEAERVALPVAFSWPVRLAQLKRCLLVERLPVAGSDKELVLVNLHLEAYDSGEGKAAQTKTMAEFLEGEFEKGNYVVAGGDFNQLFPASDQVYPLKDPDAAFIPGKIDPQMLPGWNFLSDISAPSCRLLDKPYTGDRANHQFYVIDGFIVSPNVSIESIQTLDLDFQNSDHNPVKLTFSIR